MNLPKVLLGLPTPDHVHVQYALSLAALTAINRLPMEIYNARASSICQNRNKIVKEAKKANAKYLAFIDSDMSFPPHAIARLVTLAEEGNLDVVAATYLLKTPPHSVIFAPVIENLSEWIVDKAASGKATEVERLPTGMMLINMSVFDRIPQPYFNYAAHEDGNVGTEDYYFCDLVRAAGGKVWLDVPLSLEIAHWTGGFGVQLTKERPGYRYISGPSA